MITGSPNVGKSSLINLLAKWDIAITSEIPGTTRDSISVAVNLKGFKVILTDTAGIRDTECKIEKLGIERSLREIRDSFLKIRMYDFPLKNDELKVIPNEWAIYVINKADTQNLSLDMKTMQIQNVNCIPISVKTSFNIDTLLNEI